MDDLRSDPKTLHGLLEETVSVRPDAVAVRDQSGALDYARLDELSRRAASWLRDRGVGHGDRVLVQVPNGRELVVLMYGCSRVGAVFVPLNPGMKAFHLKSVVENSEPRLAVTGEGRIPGVPTHELGPAWAELTECDPDDSPDTVTGEDIAVLIYTSGSTAAPKAVVSRHAQMVFAASAIGTVLGYRPDDVVFCRLPMSFDYGLYQILLSCLAGAELAISGTGTDLTLLRQIRETGATVVPVVPSLAGMLVKLAGRDPGVASVRLFTNTGAALPQSTIDALREAFPGVKVARMFGITECKRITIMPPGLDTERPESVGLPLPGTRVEILDEQGHPLPPGETGEIVVSGPHVMSGYWRAPELTARTYRTDAATGLTRLHTGDYGRLDEDGYLYFDGRRDDMFKYRGTRTSTVEIEAAAMDIPGVRAAAVLVPDDRHDLTICVDADLRPDEVLRGLAERLEPAKVPPVCHVLAEFPLTLNGKNARTELAELIGVIGE